MPTDPQQQTSTAPNNNQQPQPLQQSGQQTPNWPNIWNTQRHRIIKARKEQENPRNDDEKNNKITKEVEVGMLSQQQFETVVQKMASQINGNNLSQSPTILDNENNGKRIQRATFPDGGCYIREQKLEEKKAKVTYQLPSGQCVNTNDKDALFNIFQKIAYGLASEYKIKFDRQEINGLPLTIEEASIQPSTQEAQNACQQALQNVGFQVKMLKKNETFETKFNVFNP